MTKGGDFLTKTFYFTVLFKKDAPLKEELRLTILDPVLETA